MLNDIESVETHTLGDLNEVCQHCGAMFFEFEHKNRRHERKVCCNNGEIVLPPIRACPEILQRKIQQKE